MKRYALIVCAWYCIFTAHHINTQLIDSAQNTVHHIHDACVALENEDDLELLDNEQSSRKIKKICQLCVGCLNVTNHLFVNGQEITGDSQTTLSPAYGQLTVTTQGILFFTENEFLPIPFNATGPSSGMDASTTSPATITVQQDGVYQVNMSLYFSVENSDEDTFTITTYTFGLDINGVTTPAAAVYVGEPGTFSLNYSTLIQLSANDQIQFYLEASNADGPPFANNVTLENGNAHVIQIAN